uniref:VPS9 domain-containing protein n=1 Tax=Hyaloperonospora arabidopsidis (strain Emoy2) TaxID=559515 RepID=M4BF57_HYAAE
MHQYATQASPSLDSDDECTELSLDFTNVDRLVDANYLVEQLSKQQQTTTSSRRKCRHSSTFKQHDTAHPDLLKCTSQSPLERQHIKKTSNQDDTKENDDDANAFGAACKLLPEDQTQTQTLIPPSYTLSTPPVCSCHRARNTSSTPAATQVSAPAHDLQAALDPTTEYVDAHIRYAVVVRVASVESVHGQVLFRLKVSDAETQKRWELLKTLEDMTRFIAHIQHISLVDAPVKRALWGTFRGLRRFRLPKTLFSFRGSSLNAQRRVLFDAFLRQTAALVAPVPLGPRRRKAVLSLQEFVDVRRHCDGLDRRPDTCICRTNDVLASHLVAKLFAASEHQVSRACESFVLALTQRYLDDKHAFLSKFKAKTLLDTVASKMGEIKHVMLKDEVLLGQLAVARLERSETDYYEFLDEVKHAVCSFVQKHVLVALEDHVHEALNTLADCDDELALKNKIKTLQTKPQSFFGVPSHIAAESGRDWEDARRELRRVNEYALPLDKLKCLARAAGAIFQTCGSSRSSSAETMSSVSSIDELDMVLRPSMTTDEFISVHLFVLVMSNMSQLLITREFLRVMCDPQDINGELGYYLTTFEVAVSLLVNHSHPQQPMLP